MNIKLPNSCSGKIREHANLAEADGKTIDYRRQRGEVSIRLTNYYHIDKSTDDFSLSVEVGKDPKNDEFGLYREFTASGSPEKCSDDAMAYLSRYLMKLDAIRNDIKKTIDFFANTMVGNGEFIKRLNDYEELNGDSDALNEAIGLIFKEKEDE